MSGGTEPPDALFCLKGTIMRQFHRLLSVLELDIVLPREISALCLKQRPQQPILGEGRFYLKLIHWCKSEGFILIPGPSTPLSLLDIQRLRPIVFSSCGVGWWRENEAFAIEERVMPGWLLIRREPIRESLGRDWVVPRQSLLP